MGKPLLVVDAFTDRAFAGNPAAVCLVEEGTDAAWMQAVAGEMNLSETAFVGPELDEARWLRWFTPRVEVDLCGHATLAAAHVLWETGRLARSAMARFSTRSGILTARLVDGGAIELDFPAEAPGGEESVEGIEEALGVEPVRVCRNRFDLLVEVESEAVVRSLAPRMDRLAALPVRGVIVTSRADGGDVDIVTRFFAPGVGVPEDPVTGSAHCALGPYWSARLGKSVIVSRQVSERGGVVRVEVRGDRVGLVGHAITVVRGEIADGV